MLRPVKIDARTGKPLAVKARELTSVTFLGWHEHWVHTGRGQSQIYFRATMVASCKGEERKLWSYYMITPSEYFEMHADDDRSADRTRRVLEHMLLTLQYAEIGPDGEFV